jgi:hypothetical protein
MSTDFDLRTARKNENGIIANSDFQHQARRVFEVLFEADQEADGFAAKKLFLELTMTLHCRRL